MTTAETLTIVIAAAGLGLAILKVWIGSQTEIAKLQVQIVQLAQRQDKHDIDLKDHKEEDNSRYERLRKENREDHQIMFKKFDDFLREKRKKED